MSRVGKLRPKEKKWLVCGHTALLLGLFSPGVPPPPARLLKSHLSSLPPLGGRDELLTLPKAGHCGIISSPDARHSTAPYTRCPTEVSSHPCEAGTAVVHFTDGEPEALAVKSLRVRI